MNLASESTITIAVLFTIVGIVSSALTSYINIKRAERNERREIIDKKSTEIAEREGIKKDIEHLHEHQVSLEKSIDGLRDEIKDMRGFVIKMNERVVSKNE